VVIYLQRVVVVKKRSSTMY